MNFAQSDESSGGKLLLCEPCDLVGIRTSLVSGILSGRLLGRWIPLPLNLDC